MSQFFEITCLDSGSDASLFKTVVNIGIDAHLEGFTKSKFSYRDTIVGPRMVCQFHKTELPILTRRLRELRTYKPNMDESQYEAAELWADDIESVEGES